MSRETHNLKGCWDTLAFLEEVASPDSSWGVALGPKKHFADTEREIASPLNRVASRLSFLTQEWLCDLDCPPDDVLFDLEQFNIFCRRERVEASVHFIESKLGSLVDNDATRGPSCVPALVYR